jgi:hypothetical protein
MLWHDLISNVFVCDPGMNDPKMVNSPLTRPSNMADAASLYLGSRDICSCESSLPDRALCARVPFGFLCQTAAHQKSPSVAFSPSSSLLNSVPDRRSLVTGLPRRSSWTHSPSRHRFIIGADNESMKSGPCQHPAIRPVVNAKKRCVPDRFERDRTRAAGPEGELRTEQVEEPRVEAADRGSPVDELQDDASKPQDANRDSSIPGRQVR